MKSEPSLRTAIEATPEFRPGSKVESSVPSLFRRAMKSRVVWMYPLIWKEVKLPPMTIWPFGIRATESTPELG